MVTKDKLDCAETMLGYMKKNFFSSVTDTVALYNVIVKHFPNTLVAIHGIYSNLNFPDFFEAELLDFEKTQYVYEAISSFIPNDKRVLCYIDVDEKSEHFDALINSSYHYICTRRINLILCIYMFMDEFVLKPVTSENVVFTDTELIVCGNFVSFEASKRNNKIYISIKIHNVYVVQFVMQN